MTVTLGLGDAFYLILRAYALWIVSLEQNTALLGAEKFITSIAMVVFCVLLYFIRWMRYRVRSGKVAAGCMFALVALRIALRFFFAKCVTLRRCIAFMRNLLKHFLCLDGRYGN